jgi:two-component system sensor histidine kinase KdpD
MPSGARVPNASTRSTAAADEAGTGALTTPRTGLPRVRVVAGLALAVVLPALLTLALTWAGTRVGLAGDALLLLIGVVVTALVGGLWPAVVSAIIGSTLLNYFFIPPVRTLRIADSHNIWTLVGFVLVGALVSTVVHRAAATAAAASRAAAEARTLSAVAEATLAGEEALPSLLEQLRSSFGMTSASLLVRTENAGENGPAEDRPWQVLHSCGAEAPTRPEEADVQVPAGQDLVIAMAGRSLGGSDRVILDAFAAQAQGLLERDRLARSAAVAARLEATERLRDALLAAVGHDLRTPLASARAAVSSLHSRDVAWSDQERDELLATAEESLERLSALVSDLLDLSRLKAGVLSVARQAVWLDELVPPALAELGPAARGVSLRLPDDLPPAVGDAALITRVLVNVIGNALKHAPAAQAPLVSGSASEAGVELRVVDHGPGIAEPDREQVFQPFQRLGDTDNRAGLGLGLALSRGLVEAMDGTLEPQQTPGGGLTMVLTLPMAADDKSAEGVADTHPRGEDR